jgi:hypothetical protein
MATIFVIFFCVTGDNRCYATEFSRATYSDLSSCEEYVAKIQHSTAAKGGDKFACFKKTIPTWEPAQ